MNYSKLAPEIIRLHHEGLTGGAIGRQLGCSRSCVSLVRKRAGLAARKPKPPKPPKIKAARPPVSCTRDEPRDPNRADKLLRRFSFQDLPADHVRQGAAA